MAPATRPLAWHQLRFALPLAQDTAVTLVERILADSSLGRVVLELRASGGQAVWTAGCFSDSACFVLQAAFFRSRKSLSASFGVRYPRAE